MTSNLLPRGIRNNNPGNIEWGDPWQGLVTTPTDKRFAQFTAAVYGIRALARVLISYYDKHNINTVALAIARWAPAHENDTNAYAAQVARAVGVAPTTPLNFQDYKVLRPMVEAIIRHENGSGPLKNTNTWYDDATIVEALRMAGVKPEAATVANVPVTKETVGATGVGALGIAQLADVAPQVAAAMDHANDNISSGSWVRIIFGILTIAVAVWIAYSQVKKHKQATLN